MKVVCKRGGKDCVIAALATVTKSYDQIADALAIPRITGTNKRDLGESGVNILDTLYTLFELGWFPVPLISKSHPELNDVPDRPPTFATSDQIKAAIRGRLATVGFLDSDPTAGPPALAWDGNRAIDCIAGEI